MEFHTMKRNDLQALCKKHGIPANLKNVEMANRLASLFENETEDGTKSLLEDSIDCEIIVRKEAKKVTFSPENEVFEFTKSVKKGRPKKVRLLSQICAQDLQEGGVEIRRSKRIMGKGITIAGRSEDESNARRISCPDVTDFEEQKTREYNMKDEQDDPNVEKVSRRSRRFLNDTDVQTNTQERRRSIRLKASDGRSVLRTAGVANPLCYTKESKGKRKARQQERSEVFNIQDGEPVKNKAKEPSKDCKVPRRSKRLGNKLEVLMDKRPVKDVKNDDVEVEKAPKQSKELGKRVSRRLEDSRAKKGETQSQRTSGNDCKYKNLLQSLKRTAIGNVVGQAISQLPKRCSVISCEQDRASVGNLKKAKMQLRMRSIRNSSRHDIFEPPLVVEGNLVEKKTNETLEKNRDRSAEPDMGMEILSTQSNQTLKRSLDPYAQFEQEEADVVNMESRGSFKKSKTMNQEDFEEKPQGMIENSPASFGNTAAESVTVIENVLDSTLEKSVDLSQRTNTKELDSKLVEGEHAEQLEQETGYMAAVEEDKEEAEIVVHFVKDIAITAIAEENTKTGEGTFISTPRSELKGFSSVEECWKEIHSSKDDAEGSLEKEAEVAILHASFFKSNTENGGAEEGTKTTKAGCISVGHCVDLSPEKLLDEYAQLEPEQAGGPNVEARDSFKKMKIVQECIEDKQKGTVKDSPFASKIKATESDMIAENDLGSTPKCSVEISPRRNTLELNSELVEREREEKHEDKEEPLSLFVSLIKRSEVSNPEAEPGVYTGSIFVKDIDSTVTAAEDIKTEDCSVTKSTEADAKCWHEIQSIKDDEEGSVEKKIQAEDLHTSFSERNTENNKVGSFVFGGDLDSLDEVKDDNLEKSEHTKSCERGSKFNALELRRGSSHDFTSLSPKEKHILKFFGEDEGKALSQPLLRNKDSSAFADSGIFTTTERNLLLTEQLSEKGKTPTIDSVAHHNDDAVKCNDVVLTTPKQVCMLGDARIDEVEEELTATNYPDDSDVVTLGGVIQIKARDQDESVVVELQEESYIATSQERKVGVGYFKGDRTERNKESRTVELQHEFGPLVHRDQPLADSELGEAGQQQISSADKSSLFTSLERQLLSGDLEQEKEIKTGEKTAAESKDESVVPIFSERHPLPEELGMDEAAKNGDDKVMELQVDRDIFTSAEKHLLLETDEGMKGDNITANTHVVSDVCTASQYQSLMGGSEPDVSNIPTILEKHLLSGDYGVDGTKMIKENTAVTYEESFVFTSPERRQFLGILEPHNTGKQEQEEVDFKLYQSHYSSPPNFDSKDDNVVLESHFAALDSRENTITDSSSMPSKVSYNHELNGAQEIAGAQLIPKGSEADVVGLDATQGTPKKIRECSPHVDLVNHYDFDIAGKETIMEAESNVSFISYALALPAEGKSEAISESSSYLEVPENCSRVSEESGPSIDTQNQKFDALGELAMIDNNEADQLIEAKLTMNIQKGCEGNLLSNSTGPSTIFGKTCVLSETDNEHLDSRNTCEKSDRKFLETEATGPIATTFEKAISLSPDETTVEDNRKETAADEEMIMGEATPSPEETNNETTSENEKKYSTIDESVKLSEEMRLRREPNLIYRTQAKPDMKENAPHLKTLHNLNLTAPRTLKRQPLQDLRKN